VLIDYLKIALSIAHYHALGFKRVEAPWWVPREFVMLTKPSHVPESALYLIERNSKCLVASAEQSFLYMANQGMLPPGRYQATTPCFREEVQDQLRRKYFIKNELIITDKVDQIELESVIGSAVAFFATQVPLPTLLQVVPTTDGFDIEYDGIELGSYGIRSVPFLTWIFATACAEPRLSRAIAFSEFKKFGAQSNSQKNNESPE
jgi:hypothetical protein